MTLVSSIRNNTSKISPYKIIIKILLSNSNQGGHLTVPPCLINVINYYVVLFLYNTRNNSNYYTPINLLLLIFKSSSVRIFLLASSGLPRPIIPKLRCFENVNRSSFLFLTISLFIHCHTFHLFYCYVGNSFHIRLGQC